MGETRGKYLFTVLHIVNMFFIRFLILIMLLILDEWMKEKSEKILKLCIVNIVSTHTYAAAVQLQRYCQSSTLESH